MRTTSILRRRKDPVPWTWEIPLLVAVLSIALAVTAALTGRALAGLLAGTGWVWPERAQLMPTLRGLLHGHPGVQPAWLVYLLVLLVEVTALTWFAWALWRVWTTLGPGRRSGLATGTEAGAVLGERRLRRSRQLIRPDLYGPPTRSRYGLRLRRPHGSGRGGQFVADTTRGRVVR